MNEPRLSEGAPPDRTGAARARLMPVLARLIGELPTLDDRAWPLPPPDLVGTINSPDKRDRDTFVASGLLDLAHLLDALVSAGASLPAVPDVLDFGCGAGRLLRHIRPWAGRVGAVDRHRRALDWLEAHLPGIETTHAPDTPPLRRWPEATFDLVIANSVFTHIPLRHQDAWLRELARLLTPGGVALVTVLGDEHRERLLDAAARQALERDGAYELGPEVDPVSGEVSALAAVFQTPAACLESFGRVFDVRGRRSSSGHQDVLVLMRREHLSPR